MSTAHTPPGVSADELREMTPEETMLAGAEADGVHIVHRRDRFPIRGTKAEKRAERAVALAFTVSALAGVGFIVAFLALPYHWHLPGTPQTFRFYTPALGSLLAAMLLFMGVGLVLWAKWLMPEEDVVQDRHDEPSTEEDKLMTQATLAVGLEDTGLPRRSLLLRTARAGRRRYRHRAARRPGRRHAQEARQATRPHAVRPQQEAVPAVRPGAAGLLRLAAGEPRRPRARRPGDGLPRVCASWAPTARTVSVRPVRPR